MEATLKETFAIWDRQCHKQAVERDMTQAYTQLHNLYLSIERGDVELNIHTSNMLRTLVMRAYYIIDPMILWWADEFTKLEGWFDC